MVTIRNFQDGIEYVNRLGFTVRPGFQGWINRAQKRMCDTEETLYNAAGRVYPYQAHYHRRDACFTVVDSRGKKHLIDASRL